MKKTRTYFKKISNFLVLHKIWSLIIIIAIIGGGYQVYKTVFPTVTIPTYTLARVRNGNIIQTVTGTGQVSAANQLDLTSQASGMIKSINVKVGDQVHTGDIIATIDPTNALNTLNNARISYAKLTQPAKAGDLINAQNNLKQAYDSGFNSVSTTYTDLPNIVSGMKDLLYGQNGFLSDQRASYLSSTARTYRDQAGVSYDAAVNQYNIVVTEYKSITRNSATSSIDTLILDTYNVVKMFSDALKNTQNTITFITTSQPDYMSKDAITAATNVNTWSSQINSDLSSIISARNNTQSNLNTLNNLVTGTDPLDVQSAQLTLRQAEQTYSNYFIRAPFDGVIGRIPVNVYGQASNGTVIATIIGNQKIATLSLNEIDAATVKTGSPVKLTFDAINNYVATGTVSEVDLVGTVTSGVVTYTVKVAISNDNPPVSGEMINPGMSVNATITTNEIDDVLIIPSVAVKNQGNRTYTQIFDQNVVNNYISTLSNNTSSSTGKQFVRSNINMSTSLLPTATTITIGASDGTNTEVDNGLKAGDWVVTKTVTTGVAVTTSAPSLLSSLGAGNRGGFGGNNAGGARPSGPSTNTTRTATPTPGN